MPKYINDILCLSISELSVCDFKSQTILNGISEGRSYWQKVEDPADRRVVWLAYEAMKPKYRQMVDAHFGNVQALADRAREEEQEGVLAKLARSHFQSADFDYYRYERGLSQHYASQLAQSASWMRLLCVSRKAEIEDLGIAGVSNKSELLEAVRQVLADEPLRGLSVKGKVISLGRLSNKSRDFKQALAIGRKQALDVLVSGKRSNGNAKKLASEEQHSLLRQLYGRHQAFNFEAIMEDYNVIANAKGWKSISRTTVANWCKKYRKQVGTTRVGMSDWKGRVDFVVKGSRPTAPLYRIESDGTPVELYYKKVVATKSGGEALNPWGRKVGVVVLDIFNDYPLGYALGLTECNDLIRAAYRNAIQHVKELTGGYHLPWQIKADHFSKKEMGAMYTALANYEEVFATVGNAREKVIEGWFARSKEKFLAKNLNFSGYNITAKREQPNRAFLAKISDQFPDEEGLHLQFDTFIENCRNEVVDGKTRRQHWIDTFNALAPEDKRPCDRVKFLDVLGEATGYTNRLTNRGIEVTLLGQKRTYMLLNHQFYAGLGADYSIRYDSTDLSSVLAVGEQGMYLLNQTQAIPMAFKDQTEADRKNLKRQLAFKGREKRLTMLKNAKDFERIADLADNDATTEKLLTDAFAGKALQQRAEDLAKQGLPSTKQEAPQEQPPQEPINLDDEIDMLGGFSPSEYLKNSEYNY